MNNSPRVTTGALTSASLINSSSSCTSSAYSLSTPSPGVSYHEIPRPEQLQPKKKRACITHLTRNNIARDNITQDVIITLGAQNLRGWMYEYHGRVEESGHVRPWFGMRRGFGRERGRRVVTIVRAPGHSTRHGRRLGPRHRFSHSCPHTLIMSCSYTSCSYTWSLAPDLDLSIVSNESILIRILLPASQDNAYMRTNGHIFIRAMIPVHRICFYQLCMRLHAFFPCCITTGEHSL